ncbi:MAG: PAS domain S-box protein [Anaerolineae bacterium]|nr:PAS domain S-box protein [Anaerolineae bacterium]
MNEDKEQLPPSAQSLQLATGSDVSGVPAPQEADTWQILREVSLRLTSTLDLSEVLETIVQSAVHLAGATDSHIYLYDAEADTLTFGAAYWWDGSHHPIIYHPRPQGITATVAHQGSPLIINDAPNHPIYADPQARAWGVQAIAGFPLKYAQRVVGVLTVAFLRPHTFDEREVRILELLSDQAAIAIHNARLVEELRTSEDKYRSLVENSLEGVYLFQDEVFQFVNPALCRLLGYEAKELINRPALDVIAPEDRPTVAQQIGQRLSGEIPYARYEVRGLCKDGRRIDAELSSSLISYQGRPAIQGTVRDVTARKEAEAEIHRLKEFNERIVQGMEEGILIEDEHGIITFANPKLEKILGYDRGQIIGLHWTALVPLAERDTVSAQVRLRPAGVKSQYETNLLRRDGSLLPVIVSATPFLDGERYTGVLSAFTDITARKRAEEALRESEERYRLLFDKMLNGFALHEIICDETGKPVDYRFLEANPAFEKLTGLQADDIMGKTAREVLPSIESHWIDIYGKVALTGVPAYFENYAQGTGRYYEVSASSPKKGQFVTVFADVTERRRAEETFRALNAAAVAVQQAQDPAGVYQAVSQELGRLGFRTVIALLDETGEKLVVSHVSNLTGRQAEGEALLGIRAQDFALPTEKVPVTASVLRQGRTTFIYDLIDEIQQIVPDNERKGLIKAFLRTLGFRHSILAPLLTKGRAIGLLAVISPLLTEQDIPAVTAFANQMAIALENARLYETLRERAERLEQAYSELKKLDQMKDEFVQNISHELRTPLTFIRSYVDLMLEGALGPITDEQQGSLEVVANRTEGIIRLVGDIISLKRAEMANLELMTTSLVEIARLSVRGAEVTAEEAGLKIVLDVPDNLPLVQADPQRIYQVFDNLLGNAIKFSNAGGSITVRLRHADSFVRAEVVDQGIGIPDGHLDRIWERFYQVDGTSTRRFGGAGLGLAIVKRIIEAHGGIIGVESTEGKGSTFFFTIPKASAPDTLGA